MTCHTKRITGLRAPVTRVDERSTHAMLQKLGLARQTSRVAQPPSSGGDGNLVNSAKMTSTIKEHPDGHTEGHTEGHTDSHTDGHTNGHTDSGVI